MYGPNEIELLVKCRVLSNSYFKVEREDRGIALLNGLLRQVRELNALKLEGALAEFCFDANMPNEVREILERIIPQLLEHLELSDERILHLYSLLEQAESQLIDGTVN